MSMQSDIDAHRQTLLSCHAVGLLHNAGKLLRAEMKEKKRPYEFQKLSSWHYLDDAQACDPDLKKKVEDLFEKTEKTECDLLVFLSVYFAPAERDENDIENFIRGKFKKNNNANINFLNYRIAEVIKEYGIDNRLRSAFYLFRLSLISGMELTPDSIQGFIRDHVKSRYGTEFDTPFDLRVNETRFDLPVLLNIFWDHFHHRIFDSGDGRERQDIVSGWFGNDGVMISSMARLMAICHEAISEGDKPSENKKDLYRGNGKFPLTTVFGFQPEIEECQQSESARNLFDSTDIDEIEKRFRGQPSDNTLPVNDVSLYAYSNNFGAFLKTAIAGIILNRAWPEPHQVKWRVLVFRFDALAWLSRATRLADLIARRQLIETVYDAISSYLDCQMPICSPIYRDIYGICFLAPDVENLLEKKVMDDQSLLQKVKEICWEKSDRELAFDAYLSPPEYGFKINIGKLLKEIRGFSVPDMDTISGEWKKAAENPHRLETCVTCGLRPVDTDNPISRSRFLCRTCAGRRTGRAKQWLKQPDHTIWTAEIADASDHCALITARLNLNDWISSEALGRVMPQKCRKGTDGALYTSFTRIRQVWEETTIFFQNIVKALDNETVLQKLCRWRIKLPSNDCDLLSNSKNQAVDVRIGTFAFQAVFDGEALVTADSRVNSMTQGTWKELLSKETVMAIFDDSGGEKEISVLTAALDPPEMVVGHSAFPFMKILADPIRFVALVPADQALEAVRIIRKAYELEFARVQNHLPLHAGIVFFRSRIPLSSVLDCGRRLLDSPWDRSFQTKKYSKKPKMEEKGKTDPMLTFTFCDARTIEVPGNICGVKDDWYLNHLKPDNDIKIEFQRGLLDLFYLSENGKRHLLTFDDDGRWDSDFGKMPLDFNDVPLLNELWELLKNLPRSQLSRIEAAAHYLTHTLGMNPATHEAEYTRYLMNTIKQLKDGYWQSLQPDQQKMLEIGTRQGLLLIMLRIRLHILSTPLTPGEENESPLAV